MSAIFDFMIVKINKLIGFLIFISSLSCQANSDVISIGVANFPPYSIVEKEAITGIEVEIIQESLSIMGYQTNFVSYPYGRLPISFRNKEIDCTIVTLKNFTDLEVFYSDIVLREYQTVAIHLKKQNFQITNIADLENKSIRAHQRASLFYGDKYKRLAESAEKYQETARQESQVLMLYAERIDVIVLAHEIFKYFKARSPYKNSDEEYVVSKIFGDKFGFHNAFWDKKVRNDFNNGLALIKENGTYHKILSKYLSEYNPNFKFLSTH